LKLEVEALEDNGQKRLILVYGEHPEYSAEYIAHTVKVVYGIKKGHGEIRRVNINAAPFDIEGFRKIGEAGIGTYQVSRKHIILRHIAGIILEVKNETLTGG